MLFKIIHDKDKPIITIYTYTQDDAEEFGIYFVGIDIDFDIPNALDFITHMFRCSETEIRIADVEEFRKDCSELKDCTINLSMTYGDKEMSLEQSEEVKHNINEILSDKITHFAHKWNLSLDIL